MMYDSLPPKAQPCNILIPQSLHSIGCYLSIDGEKTGNWQWKGARQRQKKAIKKILKEKRNEGHNATVATVMRGTTDHEPSTKKTAG